MMATILIKYNKHCASLIIVLLMQIDLLKTVKFLGDSPDQRAWG
jgi:hypothetical protein